MEYEIVRSRRRSVCIQIREGRVVVRAPFTVSEKSINRFVLSKISWIEKHLSRANLHLSNREYAEGEKFLYLGNDLKLQIIIAAKNFILINENFLVAHVLTQKDLKPAIKKFYKEKTVLEVQKYLAKYSKDFLIRSQMPTYKFYKSKWGSCSAQNELTFNAKLSMMPPEALEYVVVHELVHIEIKNHSRVFWKRVAELVPNYREIRKWIRTNSKDLAL